MTIFAELCSTYYKEEGRRIKARIEKRNFSSVELSVRYCFKVRIPVSSILVLLISVPKYHCRHSFKNRTRPVRPKKPGTGSPGGFLSFMDRPAIKPQKIGWTRRFFYKPGNKTRQLDRLMGVSAKNLLRRMGFERRCPQKRSRSTISAQ